MRLDFDEIKKIPIVEVCARMGIRLRYRGEYANGPCPLPTHPTDDKNNKSFSIHIPSNTWRCFHTGCSGRHGCGDKPGDVINFVQVKESMRGQKEAAELLASWYGLDGNKNGPHIGGRESNGAKPRAKSSPENTKPAVAGKGFVGELNLWLDQLLVKGEESDAEYMRRIRAGIINVALQSFRNGKKVQAGLPIEPLFGGDRASS